MRLVSPSGHPSPVPPAPPATCDDRSHDGGPARRGPPSSCWLKVTQATRSVERDGAHLVTLMGTDATKESTKLPRPSWDRSVSIPPSHPVPAPPRPNCFCPCPAEGGRHGSHSRSVATAPGLRDAKESAVTPEMTKTETRPAEPAAERGRRPEKLRNIEVWARSAPIRLAWPTRTIWPSPTSCPGSTDRPTASRSASVLPPPSDGGRNMSGPHRDLTGGRPPRAGAAAAAPAGPPAS